MEKYKAQLHGHVQFLVFMTLSNLVVNRKSCADRTLTLVFNDVKRLKVMNALFRSVVSSHDPTLA